MCSALELVHNFTLLKCRLVLRTLLVAVVNANDGIRSVRLVVQCLLF